MSAPLAHWLGDGASSPQIAVAVITIWNLIDDALTPVLGGRGLVALYQRTLFLTAQACVAGIELPDLRKELQAATTPAALQVLISRQSPVTATALGDNFLHTFHGLVISLVGPSLTERLLHNAWTHASGGPPAQDTLP